MAAPLEHVLRRGAVFLWHSYDKLDDPLLAGQTKAKFSIMLSSSPLDDPIVYILTTSDKAKHVDVDRLNDFLEIKANKYSCFNVDTLIDVRQAGELDVGSEEFKALYEDGEVKHVGVLDKQDTAKLIEMIKANRVVSRRFKQILGD